MTNLSSCLRKSAAFSLIATLFAGCAPQTAPVRSAQSKLSVAVLDCGNVTINNLSVLTPGKNEGTQKKLTDTCFLVQHEQGILLWDTGINDELGSQPVDVFGGVFTLSVTNPLLSQLDSMGVASADIDYLALSHFHDDHTGNANRFSQSRLLIQRAEAEIAFSNQAEEYGFAPGTYSEFSQEGSQVIDGKFDVFGDGSVVIYPAPGHSPGHQVLFLNLEKTGPIVLSGDLYHFTGAREQRTIPSFNADPEATRQSMVEIEKLIAETKAQLWIQHDFEQMSELKRAPYLYR